MKRWSQRVLCLLVCLVMAFTMLGVEGLAANTLTVYYYNANGWENVNAFWWGSSVYNSSWPGLVMVDLGNGYWCGDVPADLVGKEGLLFNNGNGQVTANLTIPDADCTCYTGTEWVAYTGEEPVIPREYHLVGSMNEWIASDANRMVEQSDGTYAISMELKAGTYQYRASTADGSYGCPEENATLIVEGDALVTFIMDLEESTLTAECRLLTGMRLLSKKVIDEYIVGDTIDASKIRVEVQFEDKALELTGEQLQLSEVDMTTPGYKDLIASYGDMSVELTVLLHKIRGGMMVLDPSLYPESDHNYADNLDETKVLTVPGATVLTLVFDEHTATEIVGDYIYIMDGAGKVVTTISGTGGRGKKVTVQGDTVQIRLVSDTTTGFYGYAFSEIQADVGPQHTGEEKLSGREPTCQEYGYSCSRICEVCGASFYAKEDRIPTVAHKLETRVYPATCSYEGKERKECIWCDYETAGTVIPIDPDAHQYRSWQSSRPTCVSRGVTEYVCNLCDDFKSESNPIDPDAHDYEKKKSTMANCNNQGTVVYQCKLCGNQYEEITAPALGHDGKVVQVFEADCTHDGYTVYQCIRCREVYSDNHVERLGHDYTAWIMDEQPSCSQEVYAERSCLRCGEQQTSTVRLRHTFESGVCSVCGAWDPAVVPPVLVMDHPALSFEGEVMYNIYFTADDVSHVVEMGLVTFRERLVDGTVENADQIYAGYSGCNGFYMGQTAGIPAKNLGDVVYFKVYAKLTNGRYVYSDIVGYNAVAYAKSILKKTENVRMKQLVISMVNYGAEAQKFFGYDTDNLMNSFLTEEQKALVSNYDASMVSELLAVDSGKVGNFVYQDGDFAKRTNSVTFGGAFSINYYFTAKDRPDNGMKLYFWNTADYLAADTLTVDNATGSMDMVDTGNGLEFWGEVSGISAKQVDETMFVVGVYQLEGETYTTGVLAYSLGKYCAEIASDDNSNQQSFSAATAVYGYYAKEYFNNLQ